MRWLLCAVTAFAIVLGFTRHSAGAFGFWLFVSLLGIIATALAFIHARIRVSARDDTLSAYDLQSLREGKPPINHE